MKEEYVLKEDFVIPAGTHFVKGPVRREYGGDNYEVVVSISKDETAVFTVHMEQDTKKLFE